LTELNEIRKVASERIVAKTGERTPEAAVHLDYPIGMFDSGVGGLCVLKAVMKELPKESVIYFADTARVPYGGRSPQEIVKINHEIIDYLIECGAKLIVMACGTSSSIAYPLVHDKYKVPIVELIVPGSRAAAAATRNGKIGVIATAGTIDSGAFQREIKAIKPDAQVFAAACPLFVPLIEGGFIEAEETRRVAKEYLKPLIKEGIDSLVLGCTHYSHLKGMIQEIVGVGVTLVDPAIEVVRDVKIALKKKGLFSSGTKAADYTYMVSGSLPQFRQLASRLLLLPVTSVKKVNLVAKKGPIE
jgi:glutamate racemase